MIQELENIKAWGISHNREQRQLKENNEKQNEINNILKELNIEFI